MTETQLKVNPREKRIILVVHGVQVGVDAELNQDKMIMDLVDERLNGTKVNYDTRLYKYENINDKAQKRLRRVMRIFGQGILAEKIIDLASDVVLDVLVNLKNGKTAKIIRKGLKDHILSFFENGNPLYLVAHSLGTVYSFDVVNELMSDNRFFDLNNRRSWPVQGLVTLGSPLGLKLFKRNRVHNLGPGKNKFRWTNYWDRTDPVVSGSLYGKPVKGYDIVERFTKGKDNGWFIQDRVLDTGKAWLLAHSGYWSHPPLGDDLVHMVTH